MDLQLFQNEDGLELIINTVTGESFASVSGYARMASKHRNTIQSRVDKKTPTEKNQQCTVKYPKIGLRTVTVVSEDDITTWLPKDNPSMASKMLKLGVRAFLHTLAGFQITSTAVQKTDSTNDLLLKILAKQEEQDAKLNQVLEKNEELENQLWKTLPLAVEYDKIQPALCMGEGNVKDLLERLSENIQDNPTQPYHEINYFLGDGSYTKGQKIVMGKDANGFFKVVLGDSLPTQYRYQNSKKLYPECANIVFDYLKKRVKN